MYTIAIVSPDINAILIAEKYGSNTFQTPGGAPVSQAYNVDPADGVLDPNGTSGENKVNSVFVEVVTPLLDNLEMNVALRYEDFADFGLSTTVPKVSFRWEPIEGLAFRTSWGEGFLAPTIGQATVLPDPGCGEAFSGADSFGFSYIGADICSNGNANLEPEESEIFNIGLSWQATEDLEFSLDYQTIDYTNRISLLGTDELIANDYQNFLNAGLDPASSADRASWYASGQDSRIIRANLPGTEDITRIDRTYDNLNDMEVELIDLRTRYSLDMNSWGYVSASLTSTVYLGYELLQADGSTYDAVGKRNSGFNIAPPLPKYKNSLRLGWMLDSHNLAISVNNHGGVDMDYGSLDGPFTFGPTADRADPATAPQYIDAYTTIDMRYGYMFDDVAGGTLDLGIGANNATNNVAQALPVLGGLETRLQDPIGRMFYIEGTYTFE